MSGKYILQGHTPVLCEDVLAWAKVFEGGNRKVAQDRLGDVVISTVFLGLDHSFGRGPPLLFETMIFGGAHDEYQERCGTWEQAEAMHQKALDLVRS
jgi:hypothetical protein